MTVLTTDDVMILNNIKIAAAMRAVGVDMLANNDCQVIRADVWTAIQDLVIPIDHLLKTQYRSKNQFAGLTSVWSSREQWIQCQSGRWTTTPANLDLMRQHAESQLPPHVSVDDLIAILKKSKAGVEGHQAIVANEQNQAVGVEPSIIVNQEQTQDVDPEPTHAPFLRSIIGRIDQLLIRLADWLKQAV